MRRPGLALAVATVVLLASCAVSTYTRVWKYGSESQIDRLTVYDDSFRLERTSAAGVSVFEGDLHQEEEQWVFFLVRWKPRNSAVRTFDPAVQYVYRVRRFRGAVSFLALEHVTGRAPLPFIQPGDFTLVH